MVHHRRVDSSREKAPRRAHPPAVSRPFPAQRRGSDVRETPQVSVDLQLGRARRAERRVVQIAALVDLLGGREHNLRTSGVFGDRPYVGAFRDRRPRDLIIDHRHVASAAHAAAGRSIRLCASHVHGFQPLTLALPSPSNAISSATTRMSRCLKDPANPIVSGPAGLLDPPGQTRTLDALFRAAITGIHHAGDHHRHPDSSHTSRRQAFTP